MAIERKNKGISKHFENASCIELTQSIACKIGHGITKVSDVKLLLKAGKTTFNLRIILKGLLLCKPNPLCADTIWPSAAER